MRSWEVFVDRQDNRDVFVTLSYRVLLAPCMILHTVFGRNGWSHNNALQLAAGLQVDAVLEAIDETAHVLVLVDACHSGFLAYLLISRPCIVSLAWG